MKVVLDTNIFIATLITPDSSTAELYWRWREGRYELLTSQAQLGELRRVSRRLKLSGLIRPHQAGAMINTLRARATFVEPRTIPDVSPDPDDNLIIAVALEGEADYLVSLDVRDVVRLGKISSVRVFHARDFLAQ